nr:winged helix-turn-helix domain-containing protein [Variovorax paradoxus]
MRKEPLAQPGEIVSFGPFTLRVNERLLARNGVPLDLGGRAMDVLLALIARANAVVSKEELLAEAWPGVVISDGSLRYQITMLRQALGDGQDGARYVSNIVGRGYCFVAKISRTFAEPEVQAQRDESPVEPGLPAPPGLLVGRSGDLAAIAAQLAKGRFVTLVGTGGVGKTTVAVRTGHDLLADFAGAVVFVDLATLTDPSLVPTAIASMLRLSVRSADPVPSLVSYLRERRMLLVLDNCEHVIAAAASLAERIFQAAPSIHILATSREALRVRGEYVHLLNPFASPPDLPGLGAREILAYPATRLFVDRAEASGSTLDLDGTDAPIIANICRKLDGVALAIELAARRVSTYGLHQTATLLDERLALSWLGQRGAQPRHATLQATLDWSYELLDIHERRVLCRLCVFVGYFSLDAARHVADADNLSREQIVAAIASLAEKSLLAIRPSGAFTQYRLLESTRTYALSKADEATVDDASLHHARYFRDRLQQMAASRGAGHAPDGASETADLGNIRAALTWCFGRGRATELGVSLASAAVPAFLAKSLLAECHGWSRRALAQLTPALRGSSTEMHLQAAIGVSQMFTRGNSDEVRAALERSLEVAEALEDAASQVQLLGRLQIFHERIGDFVESLKYAHRFARVASTIGDATAVAAANSLVGLCNHLLGDQPEARRLLEAALAGSPDSLQDSSIYSGFDLRNRARIALARTLWLQGYPSQAVVLAQRAVDEARQLDHPVTLCIALIWAIHRLRGGPFAHAVPGRGPGGQGRTGRQARRCRARRPGDPGLPGGASRIPLRAAHHGIQPDAGRGPDRPGADSRRAGTAGRHPGAGACKRRPVQPSGTPSGQGPRVVVPVAFARGASRGVPRPVARQQQAARRPRVGAANGDRPCADVAGSRTRARGASPAGRHPCPLHRRLRDRGPSTGAAALRQGKRRGRLNVLPGRPATGARWPSIPTYDGAARWRR